MKNKHIPIYTLMLLLASLLMGTGTANAQACTGDLAAPTFMGPPSFSDTTPFDVTWVFTVNVGIPSDAASVSHGTVIQKGDELNRVTQTITPSSNAADIIITIPADSITAGNNCLRTEIMETVTYTGALPTPLTVELEGPASGYFNSRDAFTIGVRFSEDIEDLSTGSSSPTIRNFFTFSGATILNLTKVNDQFYQLTIFPGGGNISFTFKKEQATTLSGLANAAASPKLDITFGTPPPPTPGTPPPPSEDVRFTDVPTSVNTLDEFDVTITFSEVVTFTSSASEDFKVTNGSLTGFEITNGSSTGTSLSSKASLSSTTNLSSKAFKLTIKPNGNGDIVITIPAGSYTYSAGIPSTARPSTAPIIVTVLFGPGTAATITDFMLNRSSRLANNQPGLTHILQGDSATLSGAANGTDSSGKVVGRMSHGGTGTWGEINSAWSDEDSNDSSYTLVSVGGHGYVQPNTIIGGMIQFDLADDDALNITGKGWLSGPYFVHKLNEQNVYFEGRLLYGQTENEISPSNTYTDSFDSDRYLAQLRITGEYGYQTATIMPLLDVTYTEDTQEVYTNNLGRLIEEQSADLTQITFGLDFKLPIVIAKGSLDFTGGLSGIYSEVNGGNGGKSESNIKGGRGRTELGLNYRRSENGNGNGLTLTATTFYDGISSDYESYGVNFSVGMEF